MANDRMFIINKVSGRRFYLAKHFCEGWSGGWEQMGDAFQEYLDADADLFWGNEHAYTVGYDDTEEEFSHLPMIIFKPTKNEKPQ
jgi:hypothetical protein